MIRKIYADLLRWKSDSQRKPLIIQGTSGQNVDYERVRQMRRRRHGLHQLRQRGTDEKSAAISCRYQPVKKYC